MAEPRMFPADFESSPPDVNGNVIGSSAS